MVNVSGSQENTSSHSSGADTRASAVGRTEEARALIDEVISFCDRHPGEVYVRTNFLWVLGLHLLDVNVTLGDLVALAGDQAAAYGRR